MAADRSKQEARRQWIRDAIANPPREAPKPVFKCSFCGEQIPSGAFSVSQSPSGVRICASCVELAAELLAEHRASRS
jgi:hypothetical protein